MSRSWALSALLFFALTPLAGAHEISNDLRIRLSTPSETRAGMIDLAFTLVDPESGKTITDTEVRSIQGDVLHLYALDPALRVFGHARPRFSRGRWRTRVELKRNGFYHLWVQGVLK